MSAIPTLETERLVLRAPLPGDAGDILRLAGDRAVADTTLNIPHPYQPGMAEQWIATHQPAFDAGKGATFSIFLRESGVLIGAIGLVITRAYDRAEMGYWIGVPYWKQGYCTEAGRRILQFGFGELDLNRIQATHLTRNPASGRVMQKLGMTQEAILRQYAKKWDMYEDLALYSILRKEWSNKIV